MTSPFISAPVLVAFASQLLLALTGLCTRWNRGALLRATTYSLLLHAGAIGWALYPSTTAFMLPLFFLLVAGTGFAIEKCGIKFSIPFGAYQYTAALSPRLFGVPIQVAVAWWVVIVPAFFVARMVSDIPIIHILVTAQLVAVLGIFIDHTFVHLGVWRWQRKGIVFGIPLINYFGWFITTALICSLIYIAFPQYVSVDRPPLVVIYALSIVLQSCAYIFLWPWRDLRIPLLAIPLLCWPLALIVIRIARG